MKLRKVKLKKIVKVGAGQPAPKKLDSNTEGLSFIRAGSLEKLLQKNNLSFLEKVSFDEAKKNRLRVYEAGTVVFPKSGMSAVLNRTYMLEEKSYIVSHLATLEPFNIVPKYLLYALRVFSPVKLIKDLSYPSINLKSIENHEIYIPVTKDEQEKIAYYLTQLEELIQKREDSIKLLDELIKSTFLDMFKNTIIDDNPENLMSLTNFVDIDTNMVDDFIKYGELPHIGVGSIEKETGKILEYNLAKDDNLISGKYLFDERHILYSKIRPNLNKVAIPDFKGLLSADAYPLLANEKFINKYFLAYLLRSQFFISYILSHSIRANIPKVNKKQLSGFKCNIPNKNLQDKFAQIVIKIEKTKQTYQNSLDELKELFGSVSQKAFKGELDLSKLKIDIKLENIIEKKIDTVEKKSYTDKEIFHIDKDGFYQLVKQLTEDGKSFKEIHTYILSKDISFPYDKKVQSYKKNILFTYQEVIFELLKNGELIQIFDKEKKQIVLKSTK